MLHLRFEGGDILAQPVCCELLALRLIAICCVEFGQVAIDVCRDLFHTPLQFGAREVTVTAIDSLEFTTVDCNQRIGEQTKALTQQHKLTAYTSDGSSVVFAEVGDGLEVRFQMAGQPHQFDVSLRLALQTPA